ncbi:hypothetical protein TTHERM_00961920 (macronuclear) [Tetrahymena thermophila SB210]|uniref:Uncharacterized protein n=1 Tax=Tetrahymena thermophila (strain SB210) TaxID=312017 RepID=Q23TZ5_TETTS|nr:hypothetical protein TTHERM_00961920 [Tetrahymena thermophila SB210]EAR99986.2 hypothetical protein TTHERM_00961920 [Tetrahymena thermophila SB210]|eukprot:XP_001020231.2 hypothetical protein TTHERM_00961920 [Tetrahymena thermophila SB210]
MSVSNINVSDSKKKYYENPYLMPNHKPSQSFGNEKSRNLQLSLNTTSVTKHSNGIKKQDSLINIISHRSSCDNEDESPQSQKQQIYQIEKQKAENKNKMIEDFKNFIIKQHQQKNTSSNNLDIFSNENKSNTISYANSILAIPSFQKLKSQTSFKVNELDSKNGKNIKFSEDTNTVQTQNSDTIPIKRKLMRQNTITQAINKKLKIVHKTRDQLFNEKLQLFKGVSTYIETKQYLQNLNLLNKKNLIFNMKKNQQWNEEFNQIKEKQEFNERSKMYDNCTDEDNEEGEEDQDKSFTSQKDQTISKEDQIRQKFNVENPNFDKNVNLLLDRAHKHVVESKKVNHTRQNKSLNDIDQEKNMFKYISEVIQMIDPQEFLDNTDENQFYECLKEILQENKKLAELKQEAREEDQILLEQQKKKYEYELLNQLYKNPQLVEHLSSEQIQEFINLQIKQKFEPQAANQEHKSITEKLLGGLNIDLKHTNLDAKSQYQEYVEKATHIQKTLKRLNENMFKQKWANALMKRKQEKERMRNQIIKKIQNNEIEFNRIDVLFPSKNKMKNVKSKVNSNLEYSNGGYIVRSNSIDDSPKQTVHELFDENMPIQNNLNHQSHRSVQQDSQSNSTFTCQEGKQVGFSTRDIITTNSLRLIDFKEPDNGKQKQQSYYYQTPSGYIRQVTKVDLTEEEKQKKQELFEKQQLKKQQEQLKKEVLQNINHFNAKKSSAPCLSSMELPKIQSGSNLNIPQSALNSPNTSKSLSNYHMIKDSYQSKKQQIPSKASSLLASPSYKQTQTQSKFIKLGNNQNKKSQSSQNIYFNKINSFHSQMFTPQKLKDKQNNDKNTKSTIIKYQSSHTLDSQFDVSPQKSQLFNMLTTIQSEKKIQKKENKELEQQINKIQSNSSLDFTNLNGNQIGSMKDILDIDFLKFSMQKNRHIHDTNIKNFLKLNN